MLTRKPYPSEVSDDDWAFVVPYLTRMTEPAPQRQHSLRESFNGLRWLVRAGAPWRLLPHDVPPWEAVYQQPQRWLKAGCFEAIVQDLRTVLRPPTAEEASPPPLFSMGGPCSAVAKAARGRGTTATSAATAARCIWRWIP